MEAQEGVKQSKDAPRHVQRDKVICPPVYHNNGQQAILDSIEGLFHPLAPDSLMAHLYYMPFRDQETLTSPTPTRNKHRVVLLTLKVPVIPLC